MKPESTPPQVTLEQLLRVKRAERPQPEFWQQFEREMRVKQLAAIVEPRPWWASFIRIGARVARYQVPVGATAILTLTLLTVREYQAPESIDAEYSPTTVERKVDTMPGPAVAVQTASPTSESIENDTSSVAVNTVPRSVQQAAQAVTVEKAASAVPMLGSAEPEENLSPAARMIAANLETVKSSSPELAQLMERVSGMDALISPRAKTEVIDPLARVKVSNENRRSSRLLASALPAANYVTDEAPSVVSSNRLSRSLSEERLYDSVSRFGFNANRVAIKF